MTFTQWMNELDRIVSANLGCSIHDLSDMRFRDAYDDGTTPQEFAEEELGIGENGEIDFDELMDRMFG